MDILSRLHPQTAASLKLARVEEPSGRLEGLDPIFKHFLYPHYEICSRLENHGYLCLGRIQSHVSIWCRPLGHVSKGLQGTYVHVIACVGVYYCYMYSLLFISLSNIVDGFHYARTILATSREYTHSRCL